MNDASKTRLTIIGISLSILVSVAGFAKTVAINTLRIANLETAAEVTRDLRDRLIRIEVTVKNIEQRLDRQHVSLTNLVPLLAKLTTAESLEE